MLSVKKALACIGRPNGTSVRSDLFGYPVWPKEMSLEAQLKALENRHYHINVIEVAPENHFAGSMNQICFSLQVTREIFGNVNLGIGRLEWYYITSAQAGSLEVIDSDSEARELTEDWTVDNDAMDLFVVRLMTDADGRSPVNGPCDKDKKNNMTGPVVEIYASGDDLYAANGFAHEMGHYLGLDHIADSTNFIGNNGSSNSNTDINSDQGDTMRQHCLMKNPCDI